MGRKFNRKGFVCCNRLSFAGVFMPALRSMPLGSGTTRPTPRELVSVQTAGEARQC